MDMILETPRLIIRKLSVNDVESLRPILGDSEVMRYSLRGALDEEGIKEYVNKIQSHYERHGYGLWGIVQKSTDELIGIAGLIYQIVEDSPFTELAYRLARKHWGKGFATEASNAIKDYAFNELGIDRLISIIEPGNAASAKVAIRVGMTRVKSTKFHEFSVDIYDTQKIKLLAFDPLWKGQYETEKDILKRVFEKFPITFHHIGSTSIPGCSAKSIIDILGVTSDVLLIDKFNESLEDNGFIALGEYGMKQRQFFRKRAHSNVNLHIFEDSDPEVARHLRFCSYLRNHPDETNSYSNLKQELAKRDSTNITRYIIGKEKFVKSIDYQAAKEDTGKFWQKGSSSKKNTWNQEEILAAMEANMHLQMTYFAKYLPVMSLHFEPDVTVVISEIPDDTFNYIIGAKFDAKHAEKRIRKVLRVFTSKNLPFSWWVSERDKPDSLPSLLEKQGLSPKEEDIGMILFLDSFNQERRNHGLLIRRVLNQLELKNFAEVMVNIGGYSKVYEEFFEKIPSTLFGEGAPFEIYVGYHEEVPVVTGILVLHANVGGIYYIMTRQEYRKRGYGTEMMISLLQRAKAKNYHLATLQASAIGKSLYQKLGFKTLCRFLEYA